MYPPRQFSFIFVYVTGQSSSTFSQTRNAVFTHWSTSSKLRKQNVSNSLESAK